MASGGLNFAPAILNIGGASIAKAKLLADGLPLAKQHPVASAKSKATAGKAPPAKVADGLVKQQAGPQLAAQFKPMLANTAGTPATVLTNVGVGNLTGGQQNKIAVQQQVSSKSPPIAPTLVVGSQTKVESAVAGPSFAPSAALDAGALAGLAAITVEPGRRLAFLRKSLLRRHGITGSQAEAVINQILAASKST